MLNTFFSTYRFVHSNLRNCLFPNRAAKLEFLFKAMNVKMAHAEDHEDA